MAHAAQLIIGATGFGLVPKRASIGRDARGYQMPHKTAFFYSSFVNLITPPGEGLEGGDQTGSRRNGDHLKEAHHPGRVTPGAGRGVELGVVKLTRWIKRKLSKRQPRCMATCI